LKFDASGLIISSPFAYTESTNKSNSAAKTSQ